MISATKFAFECMDIQPILPTNDKEKSYNKKCWLCGNDIKSGTGWNLKSAISSTFTNHNQAKILTSDTVCFECVTFLRIESWIAYVKSLVKTDLKTSKVIAWRSYSHIFSKSGHYCPSRAEWKKWLLNPPDPPFLFVITILGKKHLIFRSRISYSKEKYHVKFEEEDFYIDRSKFEQILIKFEEFYNLGFSKKSILTGIYNQATIMKTGISIWKKFDDIFKIWRKTEWDILQLVKFCAQKEEAKEKND